MTADTIRWDGYQITQPGIYSGIPLDEYHRADICDAPSVSSSMLRKITQESPKHFFDGAAFNPHRAPEEAKKHFDIGSAAHHLICGQAYFDRYFIERPAEIDGLPWQGNRKECKKYLAAMKAEGKIVLTVEDIADISGMALSLGDVPIIAGGMLNGGIERSLFVRDPETGWWLKARPDAMPNDSGDFADLKTTTSVLYVDLQKTIAKFGYCQQAALVTDVARALQCEVSTFSLAFVESKRPWAARVVTLKDEDIARGAKLNRVALHTIVDCYERWTAAVTPEEKRAAWPGPGDERADAEPIDLPEWSRKTIDDRLKYQLREAA